jgi:basic membrane lipoprotein Med (substrate-binding protein (PBP1-ABC) superfamily)
MTTSKIQKRFRLEPNHLEEIENIKINNNFKSDNEALDYIISEFLKNKSHETKKKNQDFDKILKAINQSSKDIKVLLEFANTHAYREVFEENVSTTESPTNWLKDAKEEVSNQIQYIKNKNLSEH